MAGARQRVVYTSRFVHVILAPGPCQSVVPKAFVLQGATHRLQLYPSFMDGRSGRIQRGGLDDTFIHWPVLLQAGAFIP